MFSDILSTSTSRLTEIRDLINYISENTPPPPQSPKPPIITMRGMFFVHLYGVYEFTIRTTVVRAIEKINVSNTKINDCQTILNCLILDDSYNAIGSVGEGKKWNKRWDLLYKVNNNLEVCINADIMPTDGKNFRYRQLQSIWTSFGINEPVLPRIEIGGRLDEVVELRNAIAHGNETPLEVGKRFTVPDLLKRFDDLNEYCTYVVAVFDDYINKQLYLKVV